MTVTCLIPAYNEAARLGAVLRAVQSHPLINEVLVVDDGSNDDTTEIARAFGAHVLVTPKNGGKTKALAFGLAATRSDFVLLLDADLLGLTAADVTALLQPVLQGRADTAISLRGNAPQVWRMIGLDYISGERVIARALLEPHLAALQALPRFGFEVFLNRLLIAQNLRVAIVAWPKVASPSKARKRGFWAGLRADMAMMADIFHTISPFAAVAQIWSLRLQGRQG